MPIKFLKALWNDGEIREVELPALESETGYKTPMHGFFDSPEKVIKAIDRYQGRTNLYITLNTVVPEICSTIGINKLARAKKDEGAGKNDIIEYRYLFFDIDAKKIINGKPSKKKIPCTDEELKGAFEVCATVKSFMESEGFFCYIEGMSGNGKYLIYKLSSIKPDDEIIRDITHFVSEKFSNDKGEIDPAVFNPNRICKILGTMSIKGVGDDLRPNRMSTYEIHPEAQELTRDMLANLLAKYKPAPEPVVVTEPKEKKKKHTTIDLSMVDIVPILQELDPSQPWEQKTHLNCIFYPDHNQSGNMSIVNRCSECHKFIEDPTLCPHCGCKKSTQCVICSGNKECPATRPLDAIGILKEKKGLSFLQALEEIKKTSPDFDYETKEEGEIVEHDHETYFIKEYEQRICNFTMRIKSKVKDDDGNVSWVLLLKSQREEEVIDLGGKELEINNRFREEIAKYGHFIFDIPKYHNIFVDFCIANSEFVTKRKTQFLGRARGGKKAFAFCNKLAVPGGAEDMRLLIPPKGLMRLVMPDGDLKTYWREQTERIFKLYRGEAWKIVGFAVLTLFVDEIVDRYSFCPLEFLNGKKASGKSKCAELILSLFGASREVRPINSAATEKGKFRKIMKYRGIPIILNEFVPSPKKNETIMSIYDREGYSRAKTSNDMETNDTEINGTCIVISTRHITGFESEAVNSRLIQIDFDEIKSFSNGDTKSILLSLRGEKALSSFVAMALNINPEEVLEEIDREVLRMEKETTVESRIIENYSMVKCFCNAWLKELDLLEPYGISGILGQLTSQQAIVEESNYGRQFITYIKAMIAKKDLPPEMAQIKVEIGTEWHNITDLSPNAEMPKNCKIFFSLNECYPYVIKFTKASGDDLPDKKTIYRSLLDIGAERKNSRELVRNKQKWTFSFQEEEEE